MRCICVACANGRHGRHVYPILSQREHPQTPTPPPPTVHSPRAGLLLASAERATGELDRREGRILAAESAASLCHTEFYIFSLINGVLRLALAEPKLCKGLWHWGQCRRRREGTEKGFTPYPCSLPTPVFSRKRTTSFPMGRPGSPPTTPPQLGTGGAGGWRPHNQA